MAYKRPELLGRAIHCFLADPYPDAKLFVLDDAGMFESKDYGRWEMISVPNRYLDLGTKRSAAVAMLDSSYDAFVIRDEDDVFWPNALTCQAKALELKPWLQPDYVHEQFGDSLGIIPAFGLGNRNVKRYWGYGGAWGYRLKEYQDVGGYKPTTKDSPHLEDISLADAFFRRYGPSANSTPTPVDAHYYYERNTWKISDEGLDFWRKRAEYPMPEKMACPSIGWNGPDMYAMPVLPEIQARPF
jgi:hypothetical protein